MKPSRRTRLGLLLGVPLALSGAVWLLHARLPGPASEGDKVLWEAGEDATAINVRVSPTSQRKLEPIHVGFSMMVPVRITERQGIRDMMRGLTTASPFVPMTAPWRRSTPSDDFQLLMMISVARQGSGSESFDLVRQGGHLLLMHVFLTHGGVKIQSARLEPSTLARTFATYRAVKARAERHEKGYAASVEGFVWETSARGNANATQAG